MDERGEVREDGGNGGRAPAATWSFTVFFCLLRALLTGTCYLLRLLRSPLILLFSLICLRLMFSWHMDCCPPLGYL
jgi:hypothetical protein